MNNILIIGRQYSISLLVNFTMFCCSIILIKRHTPEIKPIKPQNLNGSVGFCGQFSWGKWSSQIWGYPAATSLRHLSRHLLCHYLCLFAQNHMIFPTIGHGSINPPTSYFRCLNPPNHLQFLSECQLSMLEIDAVLPNQNPVLAQLFATFQTSHLADAIATALEWLVQGDHLRLELTCHHWMGNQLEDIRQMSARPSDKLT